MNKFRLVRIFNSNKYIYLYSVLVFFLPLVFVSNTNELFEFPKMFFVYFLSLIIGHFFIIDLILRRVKYKKPHIIPSFLLFTYVISTLASSNINTSIWGYYTRFNDGLFSVIAFYFLYVAGGSVLSSLWRKGLLILSSLSMIPIGLYSIFQHFGIDGFMWSGVSVDRAFSTFGQPNWVAQYVAVLLPLVMYLFCFDRSPVVNTDSRILNFTLNNLWLVVFSFGFCALWYSYSLSGFLGFLFGVIAFTIIFLSKFKNSITAFKRFALIILLSFVIAGSQPGIIFSKIQDAYIDVYKRIVSTKVVYADNITSGDSYKISDPGYIRFSLWMDTLRLINSSPKIFILGTGPETFPYEYQYFRSKELNYSSEWNFVFNKPHNYYLEVLAESGLFGFAAYGLVLWFCLKNSPKEYKPGFIAFAVTNFFGWPSVSTTLLFWLYILLCFKTHED